MIFGMYEQDFVAYAILGVFMNFAFSAMFALHLSKNIGTQEMIRTIGTKRQSRFMAALLFIPFAKALQTLYRVSILQFYFLNQGKTHKDFWIYLTNSQH